MTEITDCPQVAESLAILINGCGVISLKDVKYDFDEDPIKLEFPHWPYDCRESERPGRDYRKRFKDFIIKTNLPLDNNNLFKLRRGIEDKIAALKMSPYGNLLAGPCLPIICPQADAHYYGKLVRYCWEKITGGFHRKKYALPSELHSHRQSEFSFPGYSDTFSVRLVFPQALPPVCLEEIIEFAKLLKGQHSLSFVEPLEMICAMLTYPQLFKGSFRFFFPDFFVHGEDGSRLDPCLFGYKNILSFQALTNELKPRDSDFFPLVF